MKPDALRHRFRATPPTDRQWLVAAVGRVLFKGKQEENAVSFFLCPISSGREVEPGFHVPAHLPICMTNPPPARAPLC